MWSSAWMARVDGWWVEGAGDEGGGTEWEMDCMPLRGAAGGGMLVVEYKRRCLR